LCKETVKLCIFYINCLMCRRCCWTRHSTRRRYTEQWRDQRNAALWCFYKTQGSVATHLKCDAIMGSGNVIAFFSNFNSDKILQIG